MPTFDFKCSNTACQNNFSELVINQNEIIKCPKCGSISERLFSPPTNFKLIGGGWTPNLSRDSSGNLKEHAQMYKEELKNTKSSEVYKDAQMPKVE
jgi:putative FmdB family regulatory protein